MATTPHSAYGSTEEASTAKMANVALQRPAAFRDVYDQFAPAVRRALRARGVCHDELDDALQEVFIVVFRRFGSYAADRGTLGGWIWGIAANIGAQFRERRRRRHEVSDAGLAEVANSTERPDDAFLGAEQRRRLQRALNRLGPHERDTLVRVDVHEESCEEVARAASIPVGTVWSRVHTARAKFAAVWGREEARAAAVANVRQRELSPSMHAPQHTSLEPTRAFI